MLNLKNLLFKKYVKQAKLAYVCAAHTDSDHLDVDTTTGHADNDGHVDSK